MLLDKEIKSCKKYIQTKINFPVVISLPDTTKDGSPTINNILVKPEVTVIEDIETSDGIRKATLRVKGLLCGG